MTTPDTVGPLLETKLYVPTPRARPGRPSQAERAPEPRGRVEADAHLRAGRLRQDDAAGRVAGIRARSASRSVAWLSLDRADNQAAVVLDLPDRRPADGGARRSARRALALLQGTQPPPIESILATLLNELGGPAERHRAGARRRPRGRRPRHRGRDDVPARAPAATHPPRDRHPCRSGAAARPPAGARRTRRDPRRRPALHPCRGCRVPERRRWASTWPRATSRPWRGAPKAGSPPSSWRRSRCRDATTSPASSRASLGTTATSSTT